jgi:hypothetical protein
MVLFVTLPSNKYAYRTSTDGMQAIVDKHKLDHEVKEGNQVRDLAERHTFGRLMIPPGGFDGRDIDDVVERRIPWACDNGSFNQFDQPRFHQMMDRLANQKYCHFVAAPDVVWNKYEPDERHLSAIATIEKYLAPISEEDSTPWYQFIRDRGLPAAMVGQDGLENYDIPWEYMDAYFVGGSDAWKTGAASEHIIQEALRREMWVHVGRVSSNARIGWCHTVGASSFDGSAFGRFRDSTDKGDGLGRLQAGLINAASEAPSRLFVTALDGTYHHHDTCTHDDGQWLARDGAWRCLSCDPPAFPGEVVDKTHTFQAGRVPQPVTPPTQPPSQASGAGLGTTARERRGEDLEAMTPHKEQERSKP